ncbi:MAG: hypothetical protein CM15mP68_6710 [Pseudomonadota bacterium]|nr:MAG: hypothetical protein CM15mP68_6710 [Pseudomonadota bacterium]
MSSQGGSIDSHGPLLVDDLLLVSSGYAGVSMQGGNAFLVFQLNDEAADSVETSASLNQQRPTDMRAAICACVGHLDRFVVVPGCYVGHVGHGVIENAEAWVDGFPWIRVFCWVWLVICW